MDVSDRMKLVFLWIGVSSVNSWVFVFLIENFDTFTGQGSILFKMAYEVSPILAIVSVFVLWGAMIVISLKY